MSGPLRIGRLRKRSEYLRVAATGRKVVTTGVVVQARACEAETRHADEAADAWLGITVTRRVGSAVARNRVRRRLRAVAREVLPRLARPGHDYVLIGRLETLHRAYRELVADLEGALRRASATRAAVVSTQPDAHIGKDFGAPRT